jgi:hypothetical protein
MSYIDCRDHSYVGLFFGYPVYHPLDRYDDEFDADPTNFVIGGGSGEHPGMVVTSLEGCLMRYLQLCYDAQGKDYPDWLDDLIENCLYFDGDRELFEHEWPFRSIERLSTEVRAAYAKAAERCYSHKLAIPYHTEEMMAQMFGEFIYYSGRKMIKPKIFEVIDANLQKHEAIVLFEAIQVPTKGYPISGGRRLQEVDGVPKVIWNLAFHDE